MIKLPETGKINTARFHLSIISFTGKNTLHFEVIDTNKFMYEKGYKKIITRQLSKNFTFIFDNNTYDASEVAGVKMAMGVL